jgi:hypothetical protein
MVVALKKWSKINVVEKWLLKLLLHPPEKAAPPPPMRGLTETAEMMMRYQSFKKS